MTGKKNHNIQRTVMYQKHPTLKVSGSNLQLTVLTKVYHVYSYNDHL